MQFESYLIITSRCREPAEPQDFSVNAIEHKSTEDNLTMLVECLSEKMLQLEAKVNAPRDRSTPIGRGHRVHCLQLFATTATNQEIFHGVALHLAVHAVREMSNPQLNDGSTNWG